MCLALASLSTVIPALATYEHPSALFGLSWDTAQPLVAALVSVYPKGPTVFWGERMVLFLLCASRLPVSDEVTPSELVEWVGLGAVRGERSIYGFVRRKLYHRRRAQIRRRLTEVQSGAPHEAEPNMEERLDVQQAFLSLPPKTQQILTHIANQGSAQDWAKAEQIPLRTAQQQIKDAKKSFGEALQKLSSKK